MCEQVTVDAAEAPSHESVTSSVVTALAALDDVGPMELNCCLSNYVDADALETLLSRSAPDGSVVTVSFAVEDRDVVVDSAGNVAVARRCESPRDCDAEVGSP